MKERLYLEVPTPDTNAVCAWLQQTWNPEVGDKIATPDGIRIQASQKTSPAATQIPPTELSIFVWSVQRTTYLKVFRWGERPFEREDRILQHLTADLRRRFPQTYPKPPEINLAQQSIFEALAPDYPKTVHFFKKMPNGAYDLARCYWWEKTLAG
jgi:lycopene cyclase CruA